MVTKSSIEVVQKPGNLHKIWVPLQVLNSLEPNWGDHIGVAVMLAPVAYIDHTTSPIRSCICQCKNAVSLQFHFYQLKFQADRRVLPVVPVGRRPYGTCGVSSLNLVSQPHGRLRLRGPCTWFVLFCDFFLCISSWKLHASTFQNFYDSSWYFRFWRFYARIFSSCSLGKKIHNKNYVRRLCLSGTTVPRWTRLWSQPSPPTHLQELQIEVWFRICEISFFNRDSNSLQEPQHTPSSNLCSQRNAVSSDSYSINAKIIMPITKCIFRGN